CRRLRLSAHPPDRRASHAPFSGADRKSPMTAYSTAPLPSSSRRRPIRAAIGGLLALGLGLAGCSADTAGAEPARVAAPAAFPVEIDEPGAAEAVVIEEEPNRIAVLSPD